MAACIARQCYAKRDPESEVSDARRLKSLESENAKLKKILAEQMMDVATLKEMLGKNF